MTWEELALVNMASASHLFSTRNGQHDRAICDRAYYAAYAMLTSRLPPRLTYAHGWSNPPHTAVPGLVSDMANLRQGERREIRRAIRRLRQRREDASYRPGATIDRQSAWESMRDSTRIFAILLKRQ